MISNSTRLHRDYEEIVARRKRDMLDVMTESERSGGYQINAVIYNPGYERRERERKRRKRDRRVP